MQGNKAVEQVELGERGPDQISGFVRWDALVMAERESAVTVWRKAVQAIHCYPTRAEGNGLMRRVMNALAIHVQETYRHMDTAQRDLIWNKNCSPVFEMSVRRLRQLMEYESKDYERLYDVLIRLRRLEFVFNVMCDSGKGEVEKISEIYTVFIHTLELGKGPMLGRFQFQMPPVTLRMVLDPYPYASIDMRIDNALGLEGAIALYENCVRYWGTRNRVTPLMSVETWIRLISGPGTYENRYKDFKRHALVPAIERLTTQELVPFVPELREIKGARGKVMNLQFALVPKKEDADDAEVPPIWQDTVAAELSTTWGMSVRDIAALSKMASLDEVKYALNTGRETIAKKTKRGELITSRPDYFRGILTHLRASFEAAKQADPSLDVESEATVDRRGEFKRWQQSLLIQRMRMAEPSLQLRLQGEFEGAKGSNIMVRDLLRRGWGAEMTPLWALMAEWMQSVDHELLPLLLYRAQETSYEVWRFEVAVLGLHDEEARPLLR